MQLHYHRDSRARNSLCISQATEIQCDVLEHVIRKLRPLFALAIACIGIIISPPIFHDQANLNFYVRLVGLVVSVSDY